MKEKLNNVLEEIEASRWAGFDDEGRWKKYAVCWAGWRSPLTPNAAIPGRATPTCTSMSL
jgi:hypothetical protein